MCGIYYAYLGLRVYKKSIGIFVCVWEFGKLKVWKVGHFRLVALTGAIHLPLFATILYTIIDYNISDNFEIP